jgi:hypothetical protein
MLSRVYSGKQYEKDPKDLQNIPSAKCMDNCLQVTNQTVPSDCPTVSKSDQVQSTLSDPKRNDNLTETPTHERLNDVHRLDQD